MTATTHVVLVDTEDRPTGTAEKLTAHRLGLCHRAFSVFIFRRTACWELLLQQRAASKYHSPRLWTNTCCSHPRPDEPDLLLAGQRRLAEEMGLTATLSHAGRFHYTASVGNQLTENEVDHVLTGIVAPDTLIQPNAAEADNFRWITLTDLKKELDHTPGQFTPWFVEALAIALQNLTDGQQNNQTT